MGLRRILILCLTVGLLAIVLYGYAELVKARAAIPWLLDFAKFHLSAQALTDGQDIYRPIALDHLGTLPPDVSPTRQELHPNLNMPFVAILFWPFVATDIATGMAIWSALGIVFVLACAWLMASEIVRGMSLPGVYRWMIAGATGILILVYFPSWAGASLGQLGQLLLLILCGAWLAARRGCDRLAGALFGLALALKPFTGIFLLVLPWLRRWRLVRWYVGCFAALALLGAAVAGPEAYLRYGSVLREVDWYGSGWNASLMAPLSILLGGNAASAWLDHAWLARTVSVSVSVLLYGLLLHRFHGLADPQAQLDVAVAGSVPLMLLASPLGWLYYFPLLWISALAVGMAVRPLQSRAPWWLGAIVLLFLSGLPFPFVNSRDAGQSLQSLLVTSLDTVALILAFAFVLAAAARLARRPGEADVPSLPFEAGAATRRSVPSSCCR